MAVLGRRKGIHSNFHGQHKKLIYANYALPSQDIMASYDEEDLKDSRRIGDPRVWSSI